VGRAPRTTRGPSLQQQMYPYLNVILGVASVYTNR
jgi:hypothetical protein